MLHVAALQHCCLRRRQSTAAFIVETQLARYKGFCVITLSLVASVFRTMSLVRGECAALLFPAFPQCDSCSFQLPCGVEAGSSRISVSLAGSGCVVVPPELLWTDENTQGF